ncbi:MAG: hypothetical protein AAF433_15730 [Bacteroidota bacterium]
MSYRAILVFMSPLMLFTHWSCSTEELVELTRLEGQYIQLLDAVYHGEADESFILIQKLEASLIPWRHKRRPQSPTLRFHLRQAEISFNDAEYAIERKDLDLAKTLLDRATYSLYAADPISFKASYLGNFYDFFSNWQDLNYAIHDPMLCLLEWQELLFRANQLEENWALIAELLPNSNLYAWSENRYNEFAVARDELGESWQQFLFSLETGDQCIGATNSLAVAENLWKLLRLLPTEESTLK